MILSTDFPLEIGRIYTHIDSECAGFSIADSFGVLHYEYHFMVLRAATEKEHKEYTLSINPDAVIWDKGYYYQISLD